MKEKWCTEAVKYAIKYWNYNIMVVQWNIFHLRRKVKESESKVAQLCRTLCDPTDCSLPGSSIQGISQARILEWVAISDQHLNFLTCSLKNGHTTFLTFQTLSSSLSKQYSSVHYHLK